MVWPYEIPLFEAFDAINQNDFEMAEQLIDRFFIALESDAGAACIRSQHSYHEVFEANFLSILKKHEIDAWFVMAIVRFSRKELDECRQACYKQIEIMDQFYARLTPSWECPEQRIPRDPELLTRYYRLASMMSELLILEKNDKEADRWKRISEATLADSTQADEVWERWIASTDTAHQGMDPFDIINWKKEQIEADGLNCIVNRFDNLSSTFQSEKHNLLLSISIPTELEADFPSRALTWRIWSLREAISAALRRGKLGSLFCECQSRGLRRLLFYVSDQKETQRLIKPILDAASSISPTMELSPDPNWSEYQKWGGVSILQSSPLSVPIPPIAESDSIDTVVLKKTWQIVEQEPELWARFYELNWICNINPPQDQELKTYCVDYLFALTGLMDQEDKVRGLSYMIWKLPVLDPNAAIRAYEELIALLPCPLDECTLNLATEHFAAVDPERALKLVDLLENYSLAPSSMAAVAKAYAERDLEMAHKIIQRAQHHIIDDNEENSHGKASALLELATIVSPFAEPTLLQMLLKDAYHYCQEYDRGYHKQVLLLSIANASKANPDLQKVIFAAALAEAEALETAAPDWVCPTGPKYAAMGIADVARCLASIDQSSSRQLLSKAFELGKKETDPYEQLSMYSSFAEASGALDKSSNEEFAEELWTCLTNCIVQKIAGRDSFYIYRDLSFHLPHFVKMNEAVAERRVDTFLDDCKAAKILPETIVPWICEVALQLGPQFSEKSATLLERAKQCSTDCSSDYLKGICLANIVSTAHKIGLEHASNPEELILISSRVSDASSKYNLFVETATLLNNSAPDLAEYFAAMALEAADEVRIAPSEAMTQLCEMPGSLFSELFFYWYEFAKERGKDHVRKWANNYK